MSDKKGKSVLGRGLGNLLDASPSMQKSRAEQGITDIEVDKIRANPDNPRKKFNQAAIDELAATIKAHGLLQPILVTREGEHYRVISGERRLRACRSLKLKTIPCVVKETSKGAIKEIALIENIQREQLDAIEEAMAFQAILDHQDLTQEQLAERVGKNRATVANRLRLLNLPVDIQAAVADGRLTEGQVRPLLSLKDEKLQMKIAAEIQRKNLTARDIEELVKNYGAPSRKPVKKDRKSADIAQLEKSLEKKLGTRVQIRHNSRSQKGSLVIDYFDLDTLQHVLKLLGIKNP